MKEGVLYLRVLSLLSRGGLVMLLATLSISGNVTRPIREVRTAADSDSF
jgi:hypothetical protein